MPLNSYKKSSRKALSKTQFSIFSRNKPLLDLLEIQRKSFFDLLEHGIPHELAKIGIFRETAKNSIFTRELELTLNPETYKFISPNCTPKQAILKGKTYACKLYVQATLVIRAGTQEKNSKTLPTTLTSISQKPLLSQRINFNESISIPSIPKVTDKALDTNSLDSIENCAKRVTSQNDILQQNKNGNQILLSTNRSFALPTVINSNKIVPLKIKSLDLSTKLIERQLISSYLFFLFQKISTKKRNKSKALPYCFYTLHACTTYTTVPTYPTKGGNSGIGRKSGIGGTGVVKSNQERFLSKNRLDALVLLQKSQESVIKFPKFLAWPLINIIGKVKNSNKIFTKKIAWKSSAVKKIQGTQICFVNSFYFLACFPFPFWKNFSIGSNNSFSPIYNKTSPASTSQYHPLALHQLIKDGMLSVHTKSSNTAPTLQSISPIPLFPPIPPKVGRVGQVRTVETLSPLLLVPKVGDRNTCIERTYHTEGRYGKEMVCTINSSRLNIPTPTIANGPEVWKWSVGIQRKRSGIATPIPAICTTYTTQPFLHNEAKVSTWGTSERDTAYDNENLEELRVKNNDVQIFRPWIFLGELPLMTKRGHFILNGSPRVIVNQIARCPGIYFQEKRRGVGFEQEIRVSADLIPQRGPWLRIQSDWEGRFWARLKQEGRVKYATLYEAFQDFEKEYNAPLVSLLATSCPAFLKSEIVAFQERKTKEDRQKNALIRLFKNSTRYSLGKIGRFRINQRVHFNPLHELIRRQHYRSLSLLHPVLANSLRKLVFSSLAQIPKKNELDQYTNTLPSNKSTEQTFGTPLYRKGTTEGKEMVCRSGRGMVSDNTTVDMDKVVRMTSQNSDKTDHGLIMLKKDTSMEAFETKLIDSSPKETNYLLMAKDIDAIHIYLERLLEGQGFTDDIDHLKNRFIRTSGKLLQQQFELGLHRLNEVIKPLLGNLLQGHLALLKDSNTLKTQSLHLSNSKNKKKTLPFTTLQPKKSIFTPSKTYLNKLSNTNVTPSTKDTLLQGTSNTSRTFLYNHHTYRTDGLLPSVASQQWYIDEKVCKLEANRLSSRKTDIPRMLRNIVTTQHTLCSATPIPLNSTGSILQTTFLRTSSLPSVHKVDWLCKKESICDNSDQGYTADKTGNAGIVAPFQWLRTSKPVNGAFREFFGSNPLSQYMDQTNPLAEITHKRRLSSMGPGGIKRETAGMEVRGIHPTHYGRVCPIETPEGKNAGLVNSPTVYSRIGKYGFLETPLYQVVESQVQMKKWAFFSAQQEEDEKSSLATCDTGLMPFNLLVHTPIPVQTANNPLAHFQQVERSRVGYKALSPVQTISIATALIPFLEHDDANRALMGSNMQRQAIPLLLPERPIVGTGFEPLALVESGQALQATKLGWVSHVNANNITIHSIHSTKSVLPQSVVRNRIDNTYKNQIENKKSINSHFDFRHFNPSIQHTLCIPSIHTSITNRTIDGTDVAKHKVGMADGKVCWVYTCGNPYVSSASRTFATSFLFGYSVSHASYTAQRTQHSLQTQRFARSKIICKEMVGEKIVCSNPKIDTHKVVIACGTDDIGYIKKNIIINKSIKNIDVKNVAEFATNNLNHYHYNAFSFQKAKKIPRKTITRSHLCSSHNLFLLKPFKQTLQLYQRSNQETCLTHRPLVQEGCWVEKGDFLADCSASHSGDLALGKNVTVAYMPWEGYNFEDAIVISDRLISDDVYTSLHIERYEIKVTKNSQGKERITNRIPGTSRSLKHLDSFGIARISSWVQPGDILVGKVVELKRPLSPYERLAWELASRLSPASPEREKWLNKVWLEDISLRLPPGVCGRVVNSQIVSTQWSEKEQVAYPLEVHIYLAVKRKIQIGDKLAGRHGNKGIVSTILPQQDMPYLGNGTTVDMILNPLGVPSRMNLGQIFECLLGLAGSQLGCNFKITPFDEIAGGEASRSLVFLKLYQCRLLYKQQWLFTPTFPGKSKLFDGRTGEPFENWVTVGQAYMLKLIHMVDHKIHARSTGPYSLFTRQPVRGRSRRGGQRLGEMEVWAVEGFGAAYTLQEFLTIKSDDLKARTALQRGFYKQSDVTFGNIHISPGNPEAFKVLVSELQALCLHIQM